jgi:hypothetical protein
MPSPSEISERIAYESERRARLSVPAAAGGVLFLLSAIIVHAVISGLPAVGLLQALEPTLHGTANPAISARAGEVTFLSHHALGLIAGSVLAAIAAVMLTVVLLFLLSATRFRRAQTPRAAGPLVIAGGGGLVVFGVASQVNRAIRAHDFTTGHDFSEHAVEHALTTGTANLVIGYLGLLAPLLLALGLIMVLLSATRVGLITRWLRGLGIAMAIVILPLFAGIFYLQLVSAAWLVSMAFLFAGRLTGGDPPAWAAGEARPWPSQAETRAANQAGPGEALAGAGVDVGPAPARPDSGGSSRKRRRKRGARSGEGLRPE